MKNNVCRSLLALTLSLFVLIGCNKKEEESVALVSLAFGDDVATRGILSANTFEAGSLLVETVPVCGSPSVTILSPSNPAINIPVCRASMGDYPKLLKVNVKLGGVGQDSRTYTLDLSKPEQMPAELKLQRMNRGSGQFVYQISDSGGPVKSSVQLVTYFLNSSLAVEYIDNHFLEKFTYEVISEGVIRVRYTDCASCLADLALSQLPNGFIARSNLAGQVDLDSSLAASGTYSVLLAIKRNATSSDVTMATISFTITRTGSPPEGTGQICNVPAFGGWKWLYQSIAGAQSFRALGTNVSQLRLMVARLNSTQPAAPLTVQIRSSNLNELYYSGTIAANASTVNFAWRTVTFNYQPSTPLVSGTEYAVVFYSEGTTALAPWLVNQTYSNACPGTSSYTRAEEEHQFQVSFSNGNTFGVVSPEGALPINSGATGGTNVPGPVTIQNYGPVPSNPILR